MKEKWLILVGCETRKWWEDCEKKCTKENIGTNFSEPIKKNKKGYSIILVTASGPIEKKNYENIFKDSGIKPEDSIIIFSHESRSDHPAGTREGTLQDLKTTYNQLKFRLFIGAGPSEEKNYPYWLIFNVNLNINKIQEWNAPEWKELEKEAQKKSVVKSLSLLKHRIAHLWLPLDIDLQGIMECWNAGRKDAACKYLEDVLEDKKDKTKEQNDKPTYAYYRQKLADLQYIVTGSEFGIQVSELNDPCSKDAKPVDCSEEVKEFMNGKKSVLELIEKVKKEKNENEIEELKQTLLALAGLKTNNEPQDTKHKPNFNFPIPKFIRLMDCRIKQKRYNNVEEILNFFQHHKLLDEEGKEKQFYIGSIDKSIESFNDWFCVLDSCLHKIRKNIYQ